MLTVEQHILKVAEKIRNELKLNVPFEVTSGQYCIQVTAGKHVIFSRWESTGKRSDDSEGNEVVEYKFQSCAFMLCDAKPIAEKVWDIIKDELSIGVVRLTFEERVLLAAERQAKFLRKNPRVMTTTFSGGNIDITKGKFRVVGEGNKFTLTKVV